MKFLSEYRLIYVSLSHNNRVAATIFAICYNCQLLHESIVIWLQLNVSTNAFYRDSSYARDVSQRRQLSFEFVLQSVSLTHQSKRRRDIVSELYIKNQSLRVRLRRITQIGLLPLGCVQVILKNNKKSLFARSGFKKNGRKLSFFRSRVYKK